MGYNKFPWSNFHGINLDWVVDTVKALQTKVDEVVEEIDGLFDSYVSKDELTNERRLSESGNFTGTWFGNTFSFIYGLINSNTDQIDFLTDQFEEGATGVVIDCGNFNEIEIDKMYDGGVW